MTAGEIAMIFLAVIVSWVAIRLVKLLAALEAADQLEGQPLESEDGMDASL